MNRNALSPGLAVLMWSALAVFCFSVRSFAAASPVVWTQAAPSNTQNAQPQTPSHTTKAKTPSEKGEGVVWVNLRTGVYHKKGSRWYGKTKKGEYMLEEDAIKAGYKRGK